MSHDLDHPKIYRSELINLILFNVTNLTIYLTTERVYR